MQQLVHIFCSDIHGTCIMLAQRGWAMNNWTSCPAAVLVGTQPSPESTYISKSFRALPIAKLWLVAVWLTRI